MEIIRCFNDYVDVNTLDQDKKVIQFRIKSNSHNNGFYNAEYIERLETILRNQRVKNLLVQCLSCCEFGYDLNYADLHTLQPEERKRSSDDQLRLTELFTGNFQRSLSFNRGAMLWRLRPAQNGGMYFVQDCTIKDGKVVTGMERRFSS